MANEGNERLYAALAKSRGREVRDLSTSFQLTEGWMDRFNGLNFSSVMTFLIKEAGRLCDAYASDMFYDLKQMHEELCGNDSVMFEQDEYHFVVGIRDYGVDHDNFISARLHDIQPNLRAHYRAMYEIEVKRDKDRDSCELKVYVISLWSLEHYYNKEVA